MILYYIDGQQVSSKKAKQYYVDAIKRHEIVGYVIAPEAKNAWHEKAYSEQAREDVHSITAILEQGGLEIVIED